jgi:hypothetical protein
MGSVSFELSWIKSAQSRQCADHVRHPGSLRDRNRAGVKRRIRPDRSCDYIFTELPDMSSPRVRSGSGSKISNAYLLDEIDHLETEPNGPAQSR